MDKRIAYVLLISALLFTPFATSVVNTVPMMFNINLSDLIPRKNDGILVPLDGGEPVGKYPRPG